LTDNDIASVCNELRDDPNISELTLHSVGEIPASTCLVPLIDLLRHSTTLQSVSFRGDATSLAILSESV
jgi:hypothetical protein